MQKHVTKAESKTKRRFSPKVRRSMILDKTAEMIAKGGIAKLSMEGIGQYADVSKSLMYKYFDSMPSLLKELLERELLLLFRNQVEAAEQATTFEGLVRGTTHVYLNHIAERGMIIQRLQTDPSISNLHDPTYYKRTAAVDYFSNVVVKNFDMPIELARAVTDISFGIPVSAGDYLLRSDIDREELEELTVSMIIGSYNAARFDFFSRKRKLKR